jgi:hypothetical protein
VTVVGQRVRAADASLDLLLLTSLDKTGLAEAVERAEERAGAEPHLAVRELGRALDDPVAVERPVEQRREDEVPNAT